MSVKQQIERGARAERAVESMLAIERSLRLEIARLLAENEKFRTTLEIIAEGATDKLKAMQARAALDNIGPSTGEQKLDATK